MNRAYRSAAAAALCTLGACLSSCGGGEAQSDAARPAVSTALPSPDPAPPAPERPARPAGPTQSVRFRGPAGPRALAVDASGAYWVNPLEGTVLGLPSGAAEVIVLARDQGAPEAVAVDAKSVYWSVPDYGVVRRAPKRGGAVADVAIGQARPRGLAVNNTHVFWANYDDGTLMRARKERGRPELFTRSYGRPVALAIDGKHLYWAAHERGEVAGIPLSGGGKHAVTQYAIDQRWPFGLSVDDHSIYWTTSSGALNAAPLDIKNWPKGASPVTALALGLQSPFAVATDGAYVYWTIGSSGAALARVASTGGAVESVSDDDGPAFGLAAGAGGVFWTNDRLGTLKALAR